MTGWDRFADAFLNVPIMLKYLPAIASGFVLTVELAVLVVITGIAAGLGLAMLRSLGIRPLNWAIVFVVDLFRALPPLVVIVLIYFGLPSSGLSPSAFGATWAALGLELMAFAEESSGPASPPSRAASGKPPAPPACCSARPCARWCCRRRSASPCPRSPTAPSPSPRAPRSAR